MATSTNPDAVTAPSLEMVSLDGLTPDKIGEYLEAATQYPLKTNPVTFFWPKNQLFQGLFPLLGGITTGKLSYEYESQTVQIDMMPESDLHFQFQHRLSKVLEAAVENVAATIADPEIQSRMESVIAVGATGISMAGL
ncbi:hypothetical protein GQ53DRAFT_527956 [Thozetella sp. PMI_491]|nr:hypothetical protein GQ53DRAFT_527956 [Thozetella sp. PMI_491]